MGWISDPREGIQKNSTSLTLGTQTTFDFHPPKISGGYSRRLIPKMLTGTRKNLSNLVLNYVTYLRGRGVFPPNL
jgi:hypothetical protein